MNATTPPTSTDPAKGWVRVGDIPPPSEPAFILENLIHEATTVMFGRPEAGKSYLALSMACSLVSGQPWFGFQVRERRNVALLSLDGGARGEVKRRSAAMGNPAADSILMSTRRLGEDDSRWREEGRLLNDAGVDFLIIDNLFKLMPNGASVRYDDAVRPVLANISILNDEFGIGVLLLHHAGKPGEDGLPRTSPMGATSIEAWARHFVRVEADKPRGGNEYQRQLISFGNELDCVMEPIPFAITSGGIDLDEGERRNQAADLERKEKLLTGQPWTTQQAMGDALGVGQSQVSHILKRLQLRRDRKSGMLLDVAA